MKSGTVFYGDNFGIVRGVLNVEAGYRLANVTVNGRLLQKGEILEDLLPDADMPLPGEEVQQARMMGLRSRANALYAVRQDVSRYVDQESGLQNTFYFREITEEQSVKYVFVARDGSSDYKPYQISVDLIDGSMKLIGPDENGTMQTTVLDLSKVYNPATRKITVELPESVRQGGTYWLYYSTRLVRIIRAEGSPEEVVNRVTATGKDFEGKELLVEAMDGFLYPEEPEEPETETETEEETEEETESESESESETDVPKTGDDTPIAGYFLLLIAALGVCGTELFRRRRKQKNRDR